MINLMIAAFFKGLHGMKKIKPNIRRDDLWEFVKMLAEY